MLEASDLVTVALDQLLPRADGPESRLIEAMRYAALGPGPRVRAYLALETARMLAVEERAVLRVACALECVHAFSLMHEDLAAMAGDGDGRDGRPAVHRAYDAATAIVAGDALQATAFEILVHADTHPDAALRCDLAGKLAQATGARGLAGGLMLGRLGLGADLNTVARMQRMKTGALIAFAVEAPLVLARAGAAERHALLHFAQDFGLAYQIVTDLDEDGQTPPTPVAANESEGASGAAGPAKASFVALLGAQAAEERVKMLAEQCVTHLDVFGATAAYLRASVDFVLDRQPAVRE